MSKPILLVGFPVDISMEMFDMSQKHLSKMYDLKEDYHILCYQCNVPEIKFEVLNAINATDIELEELKERVLNQLKLETDVE